MCISVDALEAGLRFPLHPLIEDCLKWWRISPSQITLNSWRYLVVFLGECRGAGIIPTRDLFMTCFRLYKNRGGYYLIARVDFRVSGAPSNNKGWKPHYLFVSDRMDLDELRLKVLFEPKVSGGKTPSTRTVAPAREVVTSPARETPEASSKRPIDASTEQARWRGLKNSTKIWNGSSATEEFKRGLLHPQLARELYMLPSEVLLARASTGAIAGTGAILLQRLEASEKELTEVRSNLVKIQRLLKEARVRARKMDDELLQSVKTLESA
ncbi:hypothetical protein B296_00056750 [Ensete ventricosum]|uniref:Transposase (putative) gypsy type domain-containing protein n=1 Tax=Ensete ventricosum TaxID=4639 RepID=A0A426WZS1_ENSVE|nr:hypothetical protein B296_00056750 [Ensete ventricosum]